MEKRLIFKKAIKHWRLILGFMVSFLLLLMSIFGEPKNLFEPAIAANFKPDIPVNFERELLPDNLNQKLQSLQKQTNDNTLHTQISETELEQLFNQLGILYRKRGTEAKITYYIADFGKNRALVGLNCDGKESICDVITVYKPFNVTNKPDLTKINQWNISKGFGTALIDEEGNPVIKARYSLYGGVSMKSVNFFFLLSGYILDEFGKYIETPS